MRSPWPLILVLASAVSVTSCGSTSGNNSGTGGTTGASGGTAGGGRGGTVGAGGSATGSGGTGGTAGGHAGGSTGGGGHGGSGSGGVGGQTSGTGGSGGGCAACAGADRASLCPADVATASMCPGQGATCCEANDSQWQCGNCIAETCHWIRSCVQTGTGGSSGTGGGGGTTGGSGGSSGATDGGPGCTQLMTEYSAAVTAALVCTPRAQNQCAQQALLPNCTTCYETVNDATTLSALRTQLIAQGCVHPTACPCAAPQTSGCVANDAGSAAGTCMPITN